MCDDSILADMAEADRSDGISRRGFALAGGAAAIAACSGSGVSGAGAAVKERAVALPTPDGTADCQFFHPGSGKHPGIVMWPDIAGVRDANKAMARRLAAAGHAVLLVNQYYRTGKAPVLASFAEWRTPEGQAKLKPMIAAINPQATARDGGAFVAWLDKQPQVDKSRGIGSNGYCMGGPFAVRTALAAPGRVKAAASLHGASLVTDAPDSPVYAQAEADRAFARMLALFATL